MRFGTTSAAPRQRKHDERHADGAGDRLVGIVFAFVNAIGGTESKNRADKRGGDGQPNQNCSYYSSNLLPQLVQNTAPGVLTAAPQCGQRGSAGSG